MEELRKAKLVKEVRKFEVQCINPLTVAVNTKGKKRLCLDLLRCNNKVAKAPRFRIESTQAALQIVERNYFMRASFSCFYNQFKSKNTAEL